MTNEEAIKLLEAYIQELRQKLSLAEKDNPLGREYLTNIEDAVKKWDSGRPNKGAQYD